MAALEDCAIIKIEEGVTCPVPLQVLHYSSGDSNIIAAPRLFIEARRNSNIEIKQTFAGAGDSCDSSENDNDHKEVFIVSNTHSIVETGSDVKHTYVQELGRNARFLEVLSADIAGDSSYDDRKAARKSEIDSLYEALNVLADAFKPKEFLQRND